jgi:two-component system, LuxR family, sensor kinase FixL
MHLPSTVLARIDSVLGQSTALRARVRDWRIQPAPLAVAAGLLGAYLALEWVSFIHEYKGLPVTPWNPGLGVVFAVMILGGAVWGLVLLVGVVCAEILVLRTDLAWPVILAMAVLTTASYVPAALAARRYLRVDASLEHVRDVLGLLAVGAAGAAVSALLLNLLLLASNELETIDLTRSALPLLVGDMIGIAVMTPLVLRLSRRWRHFSTRAILLLVPEISLYLLVSGFALWMIVGSHSTDTYKYLTLLFLPVVAAAVRHGLDGSCLALAAIQLSLLALLHWYGYDAAGFTEFQLVMIVLTMAGLLVGVVVSERQQAEARMKQMQAEAARAARLNLVSGMASALAHEISQPLTAARALARTVQELLRAPDDAHRRERADANLGTLITQIDHAGGVVRRMREFMRRGQPHVSTLDLAVTLEEALALARPQASAQHTRIDLDVAASLPVLHGDRIQLEQVVLNLIRNGLEAIAEARRAEGRIQVRARRSDAGSVEISVMDDGCGVLPGRALFEPLSSTKVDGLGLGLSISASIVEAHGGRIWLQASAPGATEFRFSLPVPKRGSERT